MLPRPQTIGYLALVIALTSVPPAAGESSPEARKWLEKLVGIYDSGPFTVDYTATLDLSQMGQAIRGDLSGRITYGDRSHRRLEMTMSLAGLPGEGGEDQAPMEMEMLSVSDGETVWTEIEMPGLGQPQVMKIAQEDVEKLASSLGMGGLAANPSSMDPVAQLELLTSNLDFEVLSVAGGKVTLRGALGAEMRESLGQLGALGVESFVLVLDVATGFPIEMTAGPAEAAGDPVVRMRFESLEKVDRASLPAGVFEYQPPEGVAVMDLASMLGATN